MSDVQTKTAQLLQQLEHELYDLYVRTMRAGGSYLLDTRLLLGDGSIVAIDDGHAFRVPKAQIAQVLASRDDVYAVPSPDQSPLQPHERPAAAPVVTEADFLPLPPGAVAGAGAPSSAEAPRDPDTGHRVPPGRPQLSEEEREARKTAAEEYLQTIPAAERPGASETQPVGYVTEAADGQPIHVPAGVELGVTPGWPVNAESKPLRLTDAQRQDAAAQFVAKTGTEMPPVLSSMAPAEPQPLDAAGALIPTPTPPSGEGSTQNPATEEDETPAPALAPVPDGFATETSDGQPRCLASKGDASQCQNPGRPQDGHPQACHMVPHQQQIAEAAAAAALLTTV